MMKIDSAYLPPKELINLDVKTLRFIHNCRYFNTFCAQVVSDAKAFLARNDSRIKKETLTTFSFESHLPISFESKQKGVAHIGGLVSSKSKNYENVSYYIGIEQDGSLIRKYHFDYVVSDKETRQSHPVFHMQYPGEVSQYLKDKNLTTDRLISGLSEPRLCYSPTSLALVIHTVLKEFPIDRATEIIETNEWRSIIKVNEEKILRPFHDLCRTHLFSHHKATRLFSDYCYGT